MYNRAISEKADVVICDILLHYNKDAEPNHYSITKWSNNNIKSLKKHITSDWIHQACHLISRKVYRKMLHDDSNALEHADIIGIKYQEDLNLLIRQLYFAEKITTLPKPFYHYDRTNQGSICNYVTSDFYSQQSRLAVNDLIDFFKKHNAYNLYAPELNWRILDNLRPLFDEGRWSEFKEINPDKRKHIFSCPWIGKYSKIMMWMLTHNLVPLARFCFLVKSKKYKNE